MNTRIRFILLEGLRTSWPICMGYFPIGLAFGVLGQKAGLNPFQIGMMSLLVFAGSSQFIAVSMLSSGAEVMSIAMTTFVINLRHFLMSSSLVVYLQQAGWKFLSAFAYGITDESFAVNMTRFRANEWGKYRALAVNQWANAAWVASTVIGGMGGEFIPAGSFGIDYALSAMFIALLVFQLRGRIYVMTALLAGVLAVALALLIPGNSYVVLASLLAATAGFALKKYAQKKKGIHV
ncbi:AzlC family ABC transporter permease [Desulfoferrobacter suflitae]|uniref:AzlC family ABC transporter permease n=1 Tax=Desulfoferrobacter suflitae TaxID=2865782 RepID=UPI002164A955|nr:AzlC family ABC transporter permease [Desulfoferrobacter suflitae]MCK8602029.1 AzlC family ABC transporter permease [Desulfoferrobacter suflitae]